MRERNLRLTLVPSKTLHSKLVPVLVLVNKLASHPRSRTRRLAQSTLRSKRGREGRRMSRHLLFGKKYVPMKEMHAKAVMGLKDLRDRHAKGHELSTRQKELAVGTEQQKVKEAEERVQTALTSVRLKFTNVGARGEIA